MEIEGRLKMVAPCGIDCGICELHTCEKDSDLYKVLISRGISEEKIPCRGCRNIDGKCPVINDKCTTYTCITSKDIQFCFDCDEFPCRKLHPAADRAEKLPHNMKVYNLCTIKNIGLEKFIDSSAEIKHRYFKGKINVGNGPQLT